MNVHRRMPIAFGLGLPSQTIAAPGVRAKAERRKGGGIMQPLERYGAEIKGGVLAGLVNVPKCDK